jgi:hypothetical protein
MNREEKPPSYLNTSTRIYVVIFGILVGIGGILHGIYEIFQGNKPTEGLVLPSIGAITLIPNYLFTGIFAIIMGLFVIVWTVGFIHKKNGPSIFLLLSIILFFVGGGVAQVVAIIIAWAVSTRIHSPLSWWEKILPRPIRSLLAQLWLPMLILGLMLFLGGVGIWLFVLPPGEIREVTATHYLLWSLLILGILILLADIILGFARDIERRSNIPM